MHWLICDSAATRSRERSDDTWLLSLFQMAFVRHCSWQKDHVLLSASHEMGNAEGLFIQRMIFFLPNTIAQHYHLWLTDAHCAQIRAIRSKNFQVGPLQKVLLWVKRKMWCIEGTLWRGTAVQSHKHHQHISCWRNYWFKCINSLSSKVCKSPNCTHRLSNNLKMPR